MNPTRTFRFVAGAALAGPASFIVIFIFTFVLPARLSEQFSFSPFSPLGSAIALFGSCFAVFLVSFLPERWFASRRIAMLGPMAFFLFSLLIFLPYVGQIPWAGWFPGAMILKTPVLAFIGASVGCRSAFSRPAAMTGPATAGS